MIPRIHLLERLLANQIAAGEVVERPASVVKELLENSIDAGSTHIDLELQQGSCDLIKVRDNGNGIDHQDLFLAVSRHATSKITTLNDLAQINTLGFRGEALASIASVSRFWLSSKPAAQEHAWQIHLNGRDDKPQIQPTAHPKGSTVIVEDLFFNTPARRKFLRSEKTEYLQMEEVFKRIALSHLHIGFSLTHNKRIVYRLPPATTTIQQQRRVEKLFGKAFGDNACKIDMQATHLSLSGWLGMPVLSRSQNDLQYIYLNGRLVRDKVINHALKQAYSGLLPEGRHALYLLYLNVAPESVDVNVHPTKHEVRFQQARHVHDFLVHAVRKALQQIGVPLADLPDNETALTIQAQTEFPVWKVAQELPEYITSDTSSLDDEDNIAVKTNNATRISVENSWGSVRTLVQKRWLISEVANGILLIDIQQAQSILLWQRLIQIFAEGLLNPRPLLFPHTENMQDAQVKSLLNIKDTLQTLGIEIDQLSAQTIIVRQLPNMLAELECQNFLLALSEKSSEQLKEKDILKVAAHHVPFSLLNTPAQQQALLEDLATYLPLDILAPPAFCNKLSFSEIQQRLDA